MTVPSSSEVVIIGGGVVGTSIAYHLARAGVRDVVLLERDQLGAGSTCKAAGGLRGQFSDTLNITLSTRGMAAYRRFPEELGQEIDYRAVGYLFLLSSPDQVAAFERSVPLQNSLGVPSRLLDVAEAKRLSPLIDTDGLLAAAYCPEDGHATPESVVLGYASGARRCGARLVTHCEVLGVETTGKDIKAVVTNQGRIATSTVICAAGAWSAAVGAMAGVPLPVLPYRRQLAFTGPLDPPAEMPFTIDFESAFYFRREGRGLMLGLSDPAQEPGFHLDPTQEWLDGLALAIERRAPGVLDLGFTTSWAGLYEVTPDHNALIGEASEVSRFLYATGFSGHGFMQAPAVGEVVRDLVLDRVPTVDVTPLDAGRFANAEHRTELNYV
ncbi:NAD(P)/FAD-dependent oxidoreductase [Kibdelosporangium phytohabitans]|uniref:Sarcosine oxidase subunit beta n=1 Tax=Kibdelosporangium phytohabitans TaxID=860235 RepID=A0A0N9HYL0_9PSEU|nr:FAD-binding oxidoreductase [Kibdelosporangium phytohabitans]ALG08369.1 sarcosine oxidase subunit beta [Kibdelosporangium phytohabitans]MBE1470585.1 sarcosine oxidase subunit beta [Kibdelosporangium phytohabitans]